MTRGAKHLLGWLAALPLAATAATPVVLDDFRDTSAWQAEGSDQVRAALRRGDGGSLCLDYDFAGVSGYAVMRRTLPVDWPADFVLHTRLGGHGPANDVQIKFVDASGDNVWWIPRPAMALPAEPAPMRFRRRHVDFAWGPSADRALKHTQTVEFVVVAAQRHGGGRGTLCVAGLALEPRTPATGTWPAPRVDAAPGRTTVDLGTAREFNGLWLQWPAGAKRPFDYAVEASDDGRRWQPLRQVRGSDGGADALFLPEQEYRWLRVRAPRGAGTPQLALRSAAQWPDRNAVIAEQARALPRGELPRAFVGEQNYWTVVGVDGGAEHAGLISEDGAVELDRGGPSIEPLLLPAGGRVLTWADVRLAQTLRSGALPIPSVHWTHDAAALDIETAADGDKTAPRLFTRYTVRNPGSAPRRIALLLALRPWQVNPPQQFLATQGGVTTVRALRREGDALLVDGGATGAWRLRFTATPAGIGALPYDGGLGLAALQGAPALGLDGLADPQAAASGLVRFELELAPGEAREIGWVAERVPAPAHVTQAPAAKTTAEPAPSAESLARRTDAAAARWQQRLGRVEITLPPGGERIERSMRTALAQILMSRDGPALRPGTRSYARSWVRDGAMMVAGLLRMGEVDAARDFTDWFGGFVFDSGKVPCCVDQRGADPVVENDSHGQYLYAVAELWRHTQDRALLERHWPRVQRVVAYMESLRQSERGEANRRPERARFFGLMPPSISHEGYSDKPAYSYWDDFWTLRGYKDAVQLAQALGADAEARRWAGWRDGFGRELVASVEATARHYGLGHIAGAADRGDFDATSTTMALNPAEAQDVLPDALLRGTFERYWVDSLARAEGRRVSKDYTPYELRTVGALVRLGQAERAHRMLDYFFADQRPAGWLQWAEVVLPDAREIRFLGDMPHAWVSSDYLRSALDLLAYEREAQQTLVLAAGVTPAWRAAGDVRVKGLSTAWGRLDYALERRAEGGWRWRIGHVPERLAGALRLAWTGDGPLPRASAGGRTLAWDGRELVLPAADARGGLVTIELEP